MFMAFPRIASVSTLSLVGIVLLVGGLGVTIVASQQQQDIPSQAASNNCYDRGSFCREYDGARSCTKYGEVQDMSGVCTDPVLRVCCTKPRVNSPTPTPPKCES